MMPIMQIFKLCKNDTIKLLIRVSPLNSTYIRPKPGFPTTTLTLVKCKNQSNHIFTLCIPLKLDDDDHVRLKMEHLFLIQSHGEYL